MSALIRIQGVSKVFGQASAGVHALREVSLEVEQGEIFGIAGPSGAGKSTLLRMINLLERPDSGAIEVAGRTLTALPARELRSARRQIGMIFQGYHLLQNLDVFDNVAFPLRLHGRLDPPRLRRRVGECLELVGLEDKIHRYPAQLSGGQKQRVAIARALANRPDILLCDEPTSALDAETTRGLLRTLHAVNAELGVTIVIVSHELPALGALCDRVAVIEDGGVAEEFAVGDLRAPRRTVLGRELAFHAAEAAAALRQGAIHV
jgi:D-methionine transport system ATP-binding protein